MRAVTLGLAVLSGASVAAQVQTDVPPAIPGAKPVTVERIKIHGAAVTAWSRLFLVPGMGHCGGGPAALDSFDMLSVVVDWVEGQKAPQGIRATGRAWPGRSRPLCPYPSHAHYRGTGDVEDAASFECR